MHEMMREGQSIAMYMDLIRATWLLCQRVGQRTIAIDSAVSGETSRGVEMSRDAHADRLLSGRSSELELLWSSLGEGSIPAVTAPDVMAVGWSPAFLPPSSLAMVVGRWWWLENVIT